MGEGGRLVLAWVAGSRAIVAEAIRGRILIFGTEIVKQVWCHQGQIMKRKKDRKIEDRKIRPCESLSIQRQP
jgi:hypothetical protein